MVPLKTCSYDCIYCQLGRTGHKTIERKEWVSLEPVLEQMEAKLASEPDYITLSGSGEPTLFSRLGELIGRVKALTDVPVAVLTNGSLLWQQAVRDELSESDLVIPSLDAGNEAMFRYVNRPAAALSFDKMLDGLVTFRQEYGGRYWLEVFLLGGVTDLNSEVDAIAGAVERIDPDRVQLNTVSRPPAEEYAYPVPEERMERIARALGERAEVIADYRGTHDLPDFAARREDVLALLRRRPCTLDDIAGGLGLHRNEVVKYLEQLTAEGLLRSSTLGGRQYYKARKEAAETPEAGAAG
jgi:wyosine [tRNA(Phe)-imidazoG37] synthetase (radical SAM superfamily)